jgi:ADP-ribosylglycohydrolase
MSARAIARRFGRVDRFRLIGQTGFVSDDTEQAALVAQSLAQHPGDAEACAGAFRSALLGWFCRLPWGVGRATVRACIRIALGLPHSGVPSAGNGAAMRAAIIGAFLYDRPRDRHDFGTAVAEVTHVDPRAVEGALYVAEIAAACTGHLANVALTDCYDAARRVVSEPIFLETLDRAAELASRGATTAEAADVLKTSGFTPHTVSFATFCFLRFGTDPMRALIEAVSAGGDTDSIAAIVGGWLGALHGECGLPRPLVDNLHDGPFGPAHLRALAQCLCEIREGRSAAVPGYSAARALARNLALWPVVLGHGFRRLLPV